VSAHTENLLSVDKNTRFWSHIAPRPDGITVIPDWGPEAHLGSDWNRPGDGWGTGWTFPEAGCWRFQIRRGNDMATLSADVFE
jgi:hypothetical protein